MSDTQMNYMAKFSLDTSDLMKGITGAAISFDAIMLAAKEAFAIMKQGYDETLGRAIEFSNAIEDLADITGESTDNIQRLRAAGLAVGTDFESISGTIKMFSQRIGDTGTNGETLRSKLAEIGVEVRDSAGNYRSAADLYMEINRELEKMPNVYERNSLAMDIYGKSWANVVDMIDDAERASKAFNEAQPIDDADIQRAKEFGIELDKIGAGLNKIKVDIGMAILDWKDAIDYVGNTMLIDNSYKPQTAEERARKADRGTGSQGDWQNVVKKAEDIKAAVDPFKGWTRDEVELQLQTDKVTEAQEALNEGLEKGADNVKELSAEYVRQKDILKDLIATQQKLKEVTKPEEVAAVNLTVLDSVNQHLGGYEDRYGQVDRLFQGIGGMDQGNQYTQEMKALQARAIGASGGLGSQGLDWRYTGENESIANEAMTLKAAYDKSTNIYVNVPEGTPADMADRVAQAISRALAQQVAL